MWIVDGYEKYLCNKEKLYDLNNRAKLKEFFNDYSHHLQSCRFN